MDGTIMVQKADGSKPFALETGSTVEKGDTLTCYEKSWVILKTHRGDRIGLNGNTVVNIDEYFFEGPDRQVRLVLKKGTLYLKTNGCGSRQSFFEINTGQVVTSINDSRGILTYDSAKDTLKVQYILGKLTVIDKEEEHKFAIDDSENTWVSGKMEKAMPDPIDETDMVNYNRFFDGRPLLVPAKNDFLLQGSD
jgi:hypothetical protein